MANKFTINKPPHIKCREGDAISDGHQGLIK